MALLILRAAMASKNTATLAQQVTLCDNRGVILHGNSSLQSLPEKKAGRFDQTNKTPLQHKQISAEVGVG